MLRLEELLCCLCWLSSCVVYVGQELSCCVRWMSSCVVQVLRAPVLFIFWLFSHVVLDKSGLYGLSNITKM